MPVMVTTGSLRHRHGSATRLGRTNLIKPESSKPRLTRAEIWTRLVFV